MVRHSCRSTSFGKADRPSMAERPGRSLLGRYCSNSVATRERVAFPLELPRAPAEPRSTPAEAPSNGAASQTAANVLESEGLKGHQELLQVHCGTEKEEYRKNPTRQRTAAQRTKLTG